MQPHLDLPSTLSSALFSFFPLLDPRVRISAGIARPTAHHGCGPMIVACRRSYQMQASAQHFANRSLSKYGGDRQRLVSRLQKARVDRGSTSEVCLIWAVRCWDTKAQVSENAETTCQIIISIIRCATPVLKLGS